jgi:hypothetical protein
MLKKSLAALLVETKARLYVSGYARNRYPAEFHVQLSVPGFARRIVSGMLVEALIFVGVGMAAKDTVTMPDSDPLRRDSQQRCHLAKRQHACFT